MSVRGEEPVRASRTITDTAATCQIHNNENPFNKLF